MDGQSPFKPRGYDPPNDFFTKKVKPKMVDKIETNEEAFPDLMD